jgi:pentatricopeptide repeat protein
MCASPFPVASDARSFPDVTRADFYHLNLILKAFVKDKQMDFVEKLFRLMQARREVLLPLSLSLFFRCSFSRAG